MKGLLCLLILLPVTSLAIQETNQVYIQLLQINEEINLLKRHFNLPETIPAPEIKGLELSPRYSWQKSYEVLLKINILREKLNLPVIAVPSREPSLEVTPSHLYEQTHRILTELELLKLQLGITEKPVPPSESVGKTITDSFNLLSHISYQLDLINGSTLTPSAVFSQSMQIYEDINTIVEALEITDDTIPPPKKVEANLSDNFEMGLKLLKEIKRLQHLAGIEGIDIYALKPSQKTMTPAEIFDLTGIILAELQTLKGHLGLKHAFTPLANYYYDRTAGDVQQILGWSLRKIQLIQFFN